MGWNGQAGREFPATNPSIRGNERLRNFGADLAVVADSAGMERQEGVFIRVLREGLACRRMSF